MAGTSVPLNANRRWDLYPVNGRNDYRISGPTTISKMHLPPSLLALISLVLLPYRAFAASDSPKPTNKLCTLHSPSTGSFYDLRPLQILPSIGKDARNDSWHAKGYDYGANFTLNFCGPVIEKLQDVNDVSEYSWRNVSAFWD